MGQQRKGVGEPERGAEIGGAEEESRSKRRRSVQQLRDWMGLRMCGDLAFSSTIGNHFVGNN